MIQPHDVALLESAFKKYYFDHLDLISVPNRVREREFGYQKFNTGMIRHISLRDDRELRLLLMNDIPSDVYCSNGYYSFPSLPIRDKDWKEADLIFDIDAKDLKLPCRGNHTCARCEQCNNVFEQAETCPACQSDVTSSKSLTCIDCINAAKDETKKLKEILVTDLGIPPESISIYFSGNEGFHIHVHESAYNQIGSKERSDIAGYVAMRDMMPERLGLSRYQPSKHNFPQIGEIGVRGRIAKAIFGSKSRRSGIIAEIKKNGPDYFQNLLRVHAPRIGAAVDPSVTMDVHRIFRMPGTLNSKSGLTKKYCQNIDKFNPYLDACLVDDYIVNVIADCPVQFTLKRKKFGPYYGEKVQIPRFAAVYLICKGFATTA